MPYSERQRKAAGAALAAKRKGSSKGLKGASLSMYKSMSISQLRDFASKPVHRKGKSHVSGTKKHSRK